MFRVFRLESEIPILGYTLLAKDDEINYYTPLLGCDKLISAKAKVSFTKEDNGLLSEPVKFIKKTDAFDFGYTNYIQPAIGKLWRDTLYLSGDTDLEHFIAMMLEKTICLPDLILSATINHIKTYQLFLPDKTYNELVLNPVCICYMFNEINTHIKQMQILRKRDSVVLVVSLPYFCIEINRNKMQIVDILDSCFTITLPFDINDFLMDWRQPYFTPFQNRVNPCYLFSIDEGLSALVDSVITKDEAKIKTIIQKLDANLKKECDF